jgi:lysophospholipase L1-like esterase
MNATDSLTLKQKLLLIIGGLVAACFIAELALRVFSPQIFELHPRGMYRVDSAVGYTLTPGFEGYITRPEFRTLVTVGQAGLRGDDPHASQGRHFRILVLGDSMGWGFGVEDNETFSVQLERLLAEHYPETEIQVLNGAVPGYGTADQLAFLQTRGAELHPDLIIVQFFSVNDLMENLQPASSWADVRDGMLVMREGTDETGSSFPQWIDMKNWLKQNSHLAAFLFDRAGYLAMRGGLLNTSPELTGEGFTQEDAQLGTRLLVSIAEEAYELNAEVLFLYSAGQASVLQDIYEPLPSLDVVQNAADEAQAVWIDSAQALQRRPDRLHLYYPMDGHWTPAGHRAIAEILAETVIETGYLPTS